MAGYDDDVIRSAELYDAALAVLQSDPKYASREDLPIIAAIAVLRRKSRVSENTVLRDMYQLHGKTHPGY